MKIVFCNGTYDILHYGHFKLLEYAKGLGDYLVVAIDSDSRVKEKKGKDRPMFNVHERKFQLQSIVFVDEVIVFGSGKELEDCIKDVAPDYMVVGGDWFGKKVIGSEYAGELIFFPRIDGFSTTKILENENDGT